MKKEKVANSNLNQQYPVGVACYATQNNKPNVGAGALKSAQNAITLISLVITIIVLLILAGVTINLTLGNNGIFNAAQKAAKNYTDAQNQELANLNEFNQNLEDITDFDNINQFDTTKKIGVNKPKLMTGMTPIKFTDPTDTVEGTVEKTTVEDVNWYDYEAKKWANAQTADGSMWVWIPRYAYRINSDTQTCDIKFLIGTTDQYYDENGQTQTAKRQTKVNEIIDTTTGYTVHPAFTDESKIDFANGGWDKELTGFWVAKFEAGYAGGNNNATKGVASSVNYSQETIWAPAVETGTEQDGAMDARNWTDGVFGTTKTAIKYPTFQGTTFSMNYICINDAFNISRVLTGNKNIYGFNASQTDSHLMKNSEWGAVSYLGQSKYGLSDKTIYVNNVNLNNSTSSVYAVTGCCGQTADARELQTTIREINSRTTNCYVWLQKEGQQASCTGTIYGIYDMSGGMWERTAGYIANGNSNLKTHGSSVAYNGTELKISSTKYTTVYPYNTDVDKYGTTLDLATLNNVSRANYAKNTTIYGDAIRETSTSGAGTNSWYYDKSSYPSLVNPFLARGGFYDYGRDAGLFYFGGTYGDSGCARGFRSVVVAL